MTRIWQYPIYLIQHGGGYVSIVDSASDTSSSQSLVVYSGEEKAIGFIGACGIMGAPRKLSNDREFGWLLQSLQAPVTGVLFDPSVPSEARSPAQRVSVRELLESHLNADNSPWNYPVYVVAQDEGFVSIDGPDADGQMITAIAFFTSEERIDTYLEATGDRGTVCAMQNVDEARSFVKGVASDAAAIALNPTFADGKQFAKHCFTIATLLDKYLVVDNETEKAT